MGNICRSPTAHGVFRALVRSEGLEERIVIDSAGTHAYHVGNPPDRRAQETAIRRGIELGDLVARQVEADDFGRFDYVLAMDRDNLQDLQAMAPADFGGDLRLFLDYAEDWMEREVPDPYYGGDDGFGRVLDMVEAASRGLLEALNDAATG